MIFYGASHLTFIKIIILYPDVLDLGFLKKIINMPEKLFLLSQMSSNPSCKTFPCPSHIEISSRAESCFGELSYRNVLSLS